jgi:hypothetical protein
VLTVHKAATALHAAVAKAAVKRHQKETLKATGLPSNASGTVTFTAKGKKLCSARVSHGRASCSTSSKLKPGTYHVSVRYPGDANYLASAATTRFTVKKH